MNILALDYGTDTGFCFGDITRDLPAQAGTWKLATKKEITEWGKNRRTRRCDPRIPRLAFHIKPFRPDYVVFEDVEFASSTYQVQLWASLRAAGWLSVHPDVRFECVPVGSLKSFASGSGNAKKEQMSEALKLKHPALWNAKLNDDAVDAIWIWLWAKHTLARA